METVMIVVAGGAIILAIMVAIMNKMKSPTQNTQAGFGAIGVPGVRPKGPPPPMPPMPAHLDKDGRKKKFRNKKGWRAPAGHYFNKEDELYTDAGELIMDMMLMAQLCGEQYDAVEPAPQEIESAHGTVPVPVDTESAASEVTPTSDFSDLNTAPSTPVSAPAPEPYSVPEPSYGGGGGYGGGGDSGGDSGGDD